MLGALESLSSRRLQLQLNYQIIPLRTIWSNSCGCQTAVWSCLFWSRQAMPDEQAMQDSMACLSAATCQPSISTPSQPKGLSSTSALSLPLSMRLAPGPALSPPPGTRSFSGPALLTQLASGSALSPPLTPEPTRPCQWSVVRPPVRVPGPLTHCFVSFGSLSVVCLLGCLCILYFLVQYAYIIEFILYF